MKSIRKSKLIGLLSFISLCIIVPVSVFANSSWHWVTISPMKVLPFAIILTLAIEYFGVIIYGRIEGKARAFGIIALANIASFVAPYIYSSFRLNMFYGSGLFYSWERAFNNGPNYIIRFGYLLLTLCIEVPLVYYLLKKQVKSKRKLLIITTSLNVITTVIVAILERVFCQGQW
ncbi:MAG: hypothetical protein RIN55_10300 [Tissierellaceae bacterium]|nr:hypothetical protein [Tissierellaceae bacterium]